MNEQTLFGGHFASPLPSDGPWGVNREVFRVAGFRGAKVMIPIGFRWTPDHVRQLIDDGATEIILRTEDDDYHHARVRSELVDRGFYQVILENPNVRFIIEVGNEQNLARDPHGKPNPLDPWMGRWLALELRHELRDLDLENISWIMSLPTDLAGAKVYISAKTREWFSDGQEIGIVDMYDGFGAHVYGHFDVLCNDGAERGSGGACQWWDIIEYINVKHPQFPIYVTEFGINHPLDAKEKAKRYIKFLDALSQDTETYPSAYVYWIGSGERHPTYQVDIDMARHLSSYTLPEGDDDVIPPRSGTIEDAVRQIQDWISDEDLGFRPIKF